MPDVSDASKDIQVSPVILMLPLNFTLLHHTILKTYGLMTNLIITMRVPLVMITEITVLKKSLKELIEAPLIIGYKEILSQKLATIEHAENMDVAICTKCPPLIIKATLTAQQEEIVVVEVEVPMALPVLMDTNWTPHW